ncbi:Glutathione S-transferase DHAR3, chloroplastic [Trichoplax sp. H2]|uniref:GST N-terminal domain-containing protein n=1 Tax=Trichoplax adhaerens TaxID=10228 RepID=B3RWE0_TRIAD|nr:hypothetical protein TRIADDRAFT_56715 [Trichoplax adhaerens]EDV25120.1 hypothetical protein TRIADDRAFT_56715 [Trichoplax adhaerens]RDD41888.1 Glutathione S-transferase DHAR3, chloroplastic [Trichoplax sp. H2]|eukprot:XP_002113010.1 hypothetical protein TRIADDRAFT_56715 [Trichoplax adhaerens]
MALTLYIKAGQHTLLGDCPFCHRVRMVAALKNIEPELVFINVAHKPESFTKLGSNTVPVMQDGDVILTDSNDISCYLDEKYQPTKALETNDENCKSAGAAIFGKFAALMKNKDSALDGSLRQKLLDELRNFNEFLSSRSNRFISGDSLTHPDCSLLPKLYHVRVAGKHFKHFDIPKDFAKLLEYLKAGFETEAFKKTVYLEDEVIAGWQKHLNGN